MGVAPGAVTSSTAGPDETDDGLMISVPSMPPGYIGDGEANEDIERTYVLGILSNPAGFVSRMGRVPEV